MKKFASLLLLSVAVGISPQTNADSLKVTQAPAGPALLGGDLGTILKDNVNVRARADKNAEVIAQLKKGETVQVKERKGEWVRIVAPAAAKCYVAAKFIDNGVVTGDAVNVRCGPGTNFRDVGKLAKADKVRVVATKGEWTQIEPTPNCSGWVAAELMEISAPTPTPAPIQPAEAPLPVPTPAMPAPEPVKVAELDEVHVQYVVKDGWLAIVKDANAPAPYALMTREVMGRSYIIAYLETQQTNISRFDGRHVRVLGNQRWKRNDRYPVITIERCAPVL